MRTSKKIDTLKETYTTLLRKCSSMLYTIANESKSAKQMLAQKMWGKRNKKAQFTLHKVLTNKLWQHVAKIEKKQELPKSVIN